MATDRRPRPQFGTATQWLTPGQEAEVRRLLAAGYTRDETAAALGLKVSILIRRFGDQLRDVRVGRGRGGGRPRGAGRDPTPEEIRERTAEVREHWPVERWLGLREREES